MPSSSSGGGTGSTFDRANPLFERPRVPCQFLSPLPAGSAGSSACNGIGNDRPPQPQPQQFVHYTLRILEGGRPCGNGGGMERCIRFEITDECAHTHTYAHDNAHGQLQQARSGFGGFGSPSVLPPSSASGPPMIQMQMQMQMGTSGIDFQHGSILTNDFQDYKLPVAAAAPTNNAGTFQQGNTPGGFPGTHMNMNSTNANYGNF
mmetsp:Transcript_3611/g.8333  ORF Transcript_3611/g.8333 Transcript_3611/m.8333 type:complete len:205 (+) Transcript_3611:662-1276(+)